MNRLRNNQPAVILVVVTLILIVVFLVFRVLTGSDVVNPAKDKNRPADEGIVYAALYKHGGIFTATDGNEDVMSQIRLDLLTFARTTRPEFSDDNTLVGFTFDKNVVKNGDTSIYTGHYYGLKDKIEIKLTPHGRGVYTLSVTNLADQTNIDNSLQMNGKRNKFIATLPVEAEKYSIRYQLPYDRIVASFYDGYTSQDIDTVAAKINEALGDQAESNVVYSINRIGLVTLEKVRQNLVTPLPQP